MAKIFISYRRRDSAYVAASLSEKLQQHFGEDSVFYDIDNIPLGVDFREHIGDAVGRCDVLLVIIGEEWITATDKQGTRRLEDPGDYVRIEIESALKRNIPLIPVLVDEAQMPSANDLPESVQSMVFRNAAELRAGSDFRQHVERLIGGLQKHFDSLQQTIAEVITKEPAQKSKTANKKPAAKKKERPPENEPQAPVSNETEVAAPPETPQREYDAFAVVISALAGATDSSIFLRGSIPDYKLDGAIPTYAPGVSAQDVLLLYDNTVFGSAKDGLLITENAVYWRNKLQSPQIALFSNIGAVTYNDQSFNPEINVDGGTIIIGSGGTAITRPLADVILNLKLFAAGDVPEAANGTTGTQTVVISSDGSCQLSLPQGWGRQMNLNSDATIEIGDPSRELFAIVIPDPRANLSGSMTIDGYLELIRNKFLLSISNPKSFGTVSTVVGGFNAREFEISGTVSGIDAKYLYAIVETPTKFYQVLTWTLADKFDESKPELLDVINSFQEI